MLKACRWIKVIGALSVTYGSSFNGPHGANRCLACTPTTKAVSLGLAQIETSHVKLA